MTGRVGLAWQNIRMRPGRSVILVTSIATLTALLVAATLIDHASREGLRLGIARLGADLVAVPRHVDHQLIRAYMTGEAVRFYMPDAVEDKIRQCPFIARTSSQLYLRSLSGAACCSVWNVFLIGIDPETDFTVKPWLAGHRDVRIGPDDVLVGAAFQARPGTTLRFFGHPFIVAGVLDAGGMGLDTAVFLPIRTARRMMAEAAEKAGQSSRIAPDQISAVFIRLKSGEQGGLPGWKAAYELERTIPEISVIRPADITVKAQKNLALGLQTLYAISFVVWSMTALLIGLVFMMAAHERQQEIGLMRAMGATRWFVFQIIQLEAIIISATGALIGLVISVSLVVLFARMISMQLEIPFAFPSLVDMLRLSLRALLLALVTGTVAAMIPAVKSSAQEPYEAIRRG